MKNILVTGGAGYIGSHTCHFLNLAGFNPVTYDNLSRGNRAMVKFGPFVQGDLADTEKIAQTIRDHRIDAIVHFAAFAYVGESVRQPDIYYKNNIAGALSLFEAALQTSLRKIVFSSTCATYGVPDKLPISESTSQNPINPYGYSKLVVEKVLKEYFVAYGLSSVSLRYFNAAGAVPGLGEFHDPETHLIPLAIDAAMGTREAIEIFGTDYETPDGTCIRDYVHVSDLADAHIRALKYLESKPGAHAINLGTGDGFSVRQVIDQVGKSVGREPKIRYSDRRPGDPPILVADPSLARQELGWVPKNSNLREIVDSAFAAKK